MYRVVAGRLVPAELLARAYHRALQARRDALADALRQTLGDAVAFDVPAGGMALWARVAGGIDVDAWSELRPAGRR